jgi:hypothetical protein
MMLNRLLFFGVKIADKNQHFTAMAREPKQIRLSVGMILKALTTLLKLVYESYQ